MIGTNEQDSEGVLSVLLSVGQSKVLSVVLSVHQSAVVSLGQVLELRLVSIRVLCPATMWASYMLQLKQNVPG